MAAQSQDSYSPLESSGEPSFEEFYRIYFESLPLREQKPKALISAIVSRPDYKILLLKRKSAVIGFSVVYSPPKEGFCLLEYMAVHAAYRDSGLGRQLFLRSVQDVASRSGRIPMLLEVDSDRESCADQAIRTRRRHFYERLGCFRMDGLPYILPLLGQGSPPQMDLMIYAADGKPLVRKSQLGRWLTVVFQEVYDCPPDDPRIALMMTTVADPVLLVGNATLKEKP